MRRKQHQSLRLITRATLALALAGTLIAGCSGNGSDEKALPENTNHEKLNHEESNPASDQQVAEPVGSDTVQDSAQFQTKQPAADPRLEAYATYVNQASADSETTFDGAQLVDLDLDGKEELIAFFSNNRMYEFEQYMKIFTYQDRMIEAYQYNFYEFDAGSRISYFVANGEDGGKFILAETESNGKNGNRYNGMTAIHYSPEDRTGTEIQELLKTEIYEDQTTEYQVYVSQNVQEAYEGRLKMLNDLKLAELLHYEFAFPGLVKIDSRLTASELWPDPKENFLLRLAEDAKTKQVFGGTFELGMTLSEILENDGQMVLGGQHSMKGAQLMLKDYDVIFHYVVEPLSPEDSLDQEAYMDQPSVAIKQRNIKYDYSPEEVKAILGTPDIEEENVFEGTWNVVYEYPEVGLTFHFADANSPLDYLEMWSKTE